MARLAKPPQSSEEQLKEMVNHPSHYAEKRDGSAPEIECIAALHAAIGTEAFIGFLKGQVIRYMWRCGFKNSRIEDAEKATWYSNKLVEVLAAHENNSSV